jgi:hypothetical protein
MLMQAHEVKTIVSYKDPILRNRKSQDILVCDGPVRITRV